MSRALFEIGADLEALNRLCEEAEESLDRAPEMDAALADWFEQLGAEQAQKAEAYRMLLVRLESEAAAAKAEAEQFEKMAKTRENRAKWLKGRMKEYMERMGMKKLLTSTGREFAIQKNGGVVPMLPEKILLETIPQEWHGLVTRTEVVVDTKSIRERLERGDELPFARLGDRGSHIRVK